MTKTILYLISAGLVLLVCNQYIAGNPMYRNKVERLDFNYTKVARAMETDCAEPLTLVIGNSYVGASFVEQEQCQVLRFVVGGMPLEDMVNIVRHLPKGFRFRTLVAGMAYIYASPVVSDSNAYMPFWSSTALERMWWSLPLVQGRAQASIMLKEDLKKLLAGRGEKAVHPAEAKGASPEEHDRLMQRSIRARWAEYEPFTKGISPRFSALLGELRELCDERGVALVLYTAPIHPEVHARLSSDFLADFHAAIEAQGIPYLDLNDISSDWDSSYFNDASHVREKGSDITTPMILDFARRSTKG